MIKRFCDACDKEISRTANRSEFTKTFLPESEHSTKVSVEVLVSINGTANNGEICIDCIKKTINEGTQSFKNMR